MFEYLSLIFGFQEGYSGKDNFIYWVELFIITIAKKTIKIDSQLVGQLEHQTV